MRLLDLSGLVVLAGIVLGGAGHARAGVVLSNIPPAYTSPTYNINGQVNTGLGINYAVEFAATTTETVNSATLILSIQPRTTPTLGIYTATAKNAIGSLVGSFSDANLTFGTAVTETFTGTAVLASGSSYFLVLDGNNYFNWAATFTGAAPNGLVPVGPGGTYLAAGGLGSYAAGNVKPSFELDAASIAAPEPATLVSCLAGGLALLAGRRLRRRQCVPIA